MNFLEMFLPLILKYGPQLEMDIVAAVHKSGYTVAQIDAAFADLKPYDQLGINPNAPVVPETTTTTTTTTTSTPPTPPTT